MMEKEKIRYVLIVGNKVVQGEMESVTETIEELEKREGKKR